MRMRYFWDYCVSTHSRLKAAGAEAAQKAKAQQVSTHSRLKAAGPVFIGSAWEYHGFNTQPPEGGWWQDSFYIFQSIEVSTHSRLKAAGYNGWNIPNEYSVSTHSRLKAAGSLAC